MFLHPERHYYAEEWVRGSGLDRGNLSRKLRELESEGVLVSAVKGKEKYYRLNTSYPFLEEYRRIILKSVGAESEIRKVIRSVKGVQKAFLFGSYVSGKMDGASDIDMVVVGRHDTLELQRRLSVLQKKVSREINMISLSPEEYERKRTSAGLFKRLKNMKTINLI